MVLLIVAFLTDHCIKLLLKAKTHLIEVEKVRVSAYGDIVDYCFVSFTHYKYITK